MSDIAGTQKRTAIDEMAAQLYRIHEPALQRFARKLTRGDSQRAEDIVQETLLRAWSHPEVLCTRTSIEPWLFTVARRIAIDMWRARSICKEVGDERQEEKPDPNDPIERTIATLDVRAALATLSAEHREVIYATYYRNQTTAEIAKELSIPVGTVKSRTYYAMRALRCALHERACWPGRPVPVSPVSPARGSIKTSVAVSPTR